MAFDEGSVDGARSVAILRWGDAKFEWLRRDTPESLTTMSASERDR